MNIVFRTDASLQIGVGHVMRCLTLADVMQAAGAQCHFICREHAGNLVAQIRQRGFAVGILPAASDDSTADDLTNEASLDHAAWLGTYWATDAAQTKAEVRAMMVDWMIVDHYAIDARWEQALRPLCRKLMVIDDLADRRHDCDLLLDQNLGRNAGDYGEFVPEGCSVLAGPHFALLRPEFAALREYSLRRHVDAQLKHLLISMGGVDQDNATGKVLEVLQACSLPSDLRINVVMGPHAPWLRPVQLLANRMPNSTEVKTNVDNMAQLMADCDLAIGAAGSTSWERCCLGLPALIVVLAENQRKGAIALERSGSVKLLGGVSAIPDALPSALNSLASTDELIQLSQKSRLIADGHGARRVQEILTGIQG